MAIFIELTTDAFEEVLGNQTAIARSSGVAGRSPRAGRRVARRPTRGLEIKEDTYAAIKVILSDGSELPMVDSSWAEGMDNGYTNFMLQSVQEVRMEKHQIVETFGASYIYFFGENPRFLDVSAVIINSHDFNWEAEWWENYEQNFRGTRLVEKGGRLYMFYDDNIVEGYMLQCEATKQSEEPHLIPITFRLYLTNYRNVSFIGSKQFPVHEGTLIPEIIDVPSRQLGGPRDQATLNAAPDRGSALTRAVSNGAFSTAPRLRDLLRDASQTGAVDPTTQAALDRLGVVVPPGRTAPLRSLISANFDEYVGLPINSVTQSPAPGVNPRALSSADQKRLETDDLHRETVDQLGDHGADVNEPGILEDLGLMPKFDFNAKGPATFRPKEGGIGFGTGFSFGLGQESVGNDPTGEAKSFRQDPLGAVFGGSLTLGRKMDNRFTAGVGDAKYGYSSEFAQGPGFGQAGYGDLGGPGFGSGQGANGDPGFKDPTKFSFAGIVTKKAAFAKFIKPKPDQSSFGKGAGIGAGSAGLSGGSSVKVGGKPSPFAIVSVDGTLKVF